jgi:hypothetical protein
MKVFEWAIIRNHDIVQCKNVTHKIIWYHMQQAMNIWISLFSGTHISAQLHSLSMSVIFNLSCHAVPGEHMVHVHFILWIYSVPIWAPLLFSNLNKFWIRYPNFLQHWSWFACVVTSVSSSPIGLKCMCYWKQEFNVTHNYIWFTAKPQVQVPWHTIVLMGARILIHRDQMFTSNHQGQRVLSKSCDAWRA